MSDTTNNRPGTLAGTKKAAAPMLPPAAPEVTRPGDWTVREGAGWVNMATREMAIPMSDSPEDRHVRAHELLHTRATPQELPARARAAGVSWNAFQGCEDGRLGTIARQHRIRALLDAGAISEEACFKSCEQRIAAIRRAHTGGNRDGLAHTGLSRNANSQSVPAGGASGLPALPGQSPARLAHELACAALATTCTPLQGIIGEAIAEACVSEPETMPRALSYMLPRVIATARGMLQPHDPDSTIRAAAHLDTLLQLDPEEGDESDDNGSKGLNHDPHRINPGEGSQEGCRADPNAITAIRPPLAAKGNQQRQRVRRRSTDAGRLTRPQEALRMDGTGAPFTRTRRQAAGTVVIDVSGSMHLEHEHLQRIIAAAPGALILTYANDRDEHGRAVVRIVGEHGRIIAPADMSTGGGNLDDASVLAWAAKHGPAGPRVWVSDGMAGNQEGHIDPGTVAYTAKVARQLGYTRVDSGAEVIS
jgi:hypothetical protein